MVTFPIRPVEPARDPCPRADLRAGLERLAGGPVEAWSSPRWPLVQPPLQRYRVDAMEGPVRDMPCHPFVGAVHAAFDGHRPLELSPDAVWLCIAQGFATHVRLYAEELRHHFVPYQGRAALIANRPDFVKGSPHNDWPGVFSEFSRQVRDLAGPLHGLVVSDFSTTDAVAQAACEVTLLEAASPYARFAVYSGCGIPSLSLTGTTDDWRYLRSRAALLAPYGAAWWVEALLPVLDQFVAAMSGRVDHDFWASFYKFRSVSGGPFITGWINTLLPYTVLNDGKPQRNPGVATWSKGMGPNPQELPVGLAAAPLLWRYPDKEYPMNLLGGFIGVGQDPTSLTVRPEIGWAVQPRPSAPP